MSSAVQAYLNEQRSLSDANLSQHWAEIETLYSKRCEHVYFQPSLIIF